MTLPIVVGGLESSGKTSLICSLLKMAEANGNSCAGFKPFDKGLLKRNAADQQGDGEKFCGLMKNEPMETLVSPYCAHEDYPLEMSFRRDGIGISWNIIKERIAILDETYDKTYIELPSSLLSPVTEESMIIDWLKELQAPIIWMIHPLQDQFYRNLYETKLLKDSGLDYTLVFNNASQITDQDLLFYTWEKIESFAGQEAAGMIPFVPALNESFDHMVEKLKEFLPDVVDSVLPHQQQSTSF
ncbi:MAG: dethiobiotin synthase [Proteobacteria bacterium]|nr:dethiobiotin synthase [Pseudomonadota bacterium]